MVGEYSYSTKLALGDTYVCFLFKDINAEYHHFGGYRNSLLIGLIPLSNSLSTSQKNSTKTEIEHIFNGCYCPLDRAPSSYCSLQWSDCSGPILFLSLMSIYRNELLSFPPMVQLHLGSHTCCPLGLNIPQLLEFSPLLTHLSLSLTSHILKMMHGEAKTLFYY